MWLVVLLAVVYVASASRRSSPQLLTTPKEKENTKFKPYFSLASIQGRRKHMEDEYVMSKNGLFCGVFDGHGGSQVSKYAKRCLYAAFLHNLEEKRPWSDDNIVSALNESLNQVDRDIVSMQRWNHQGCTVAVAYLNIDNLNKISSLITANLGDSRIVLSRNGKAIQLTNDHKPNDPLERIRIEKAGGTVEWHGLVRDKKPIPGTGVYRLNGNLSLSRALGDRLERPCLSSNADICVHEVDLETDGYALVYIQSLHLITITTFLTGT